MWDCGRSSLRPYQIQFCNNLLAEIRTKTDKIDFSTIVSLGYSNLLAARIMHLINISKDGVVESSDNE